jgi:transcriptional regulator with XRE-family HTH domain
METRQPTLGEFIARARAARGWTQEDLALRAEVRLSSLRNWESGRFRPSLAQALSLALVLDLTLAQLHAAVVVPGKPPPRRPGPTPKPPLFVTAERI